VKVRWIVAASSRTPKIMPTPSTIPAAVSSTRRRRLPNWRKVSE
jgi:hypothetical protein